MANITLSIDDALLQAAHVRAVKEGTSVNEICRQAIERYARRREDRLARYLDLQARIEEATAADEFVVSTQVLAEFYSNAARMKVVGPAQARDLVRLWSEHHAVQNTAELLLRGISLHRHLPHIPESRSRESRLQLFIDSIDCATAASPARKGRKADARQARAIVRGGG